MGGQKSQKKKKQVAKNSINNAEFDQQCIATMQQTDHFPLPLFSLFLRRIFQIHQKSLFIHVLDSQTNFLAF